MAKKKLSEEDVKAAMSATEDDTEEKTRGPETEEPVTVDLDDDEDGGEEQQAQAPRGERRANRFREAQERAEEAERRRLEAEERAARLQEAFLANLSNGRSQGGQQAGEEKDPHQEKIDSLLARKRQLRTMAAALAQAGRAGDIPKEMEEEYERIDIDIVDALAEKKLAARERAQGSQQQAPNATLQVLQMQHPEVYADQRATRWAQGRFLQLRSLSSNQDKPEIVLVRQALKEAEQEFGYSSRDVSEGQRAKYAGVAKGAGGSSTTAKQSFTLDAATRKMADAALSHIKDPKERYKTYAKKVLSKRQSAG